MTVEELKKILATMPGGQEIVMSVDDEGNAFRPLSECGDGWYIPRRGEVWNDDDIKEVQGEQHQRVLVLW